MAQMENPCHFVEFICPHLAILFVVVPGAVRHKPLRCLAKSLASLVLHDFCTETEVRIISTLSNHRETRRILMSGRRWIPAAAVVALTLIMCSPGFAGVPPNQPENPTPVDSAVGVSQTVVVSWDCTDPDPSEILAYEVWIHRVPDNWPPGVPYTSLSQVTGAPLEFRNWTFACLWPDTIYVWKVVAVDDEGYRTDGPIWSFTTGHSSGITSITPNPARLGSIVTIRGHSLLIPGGSPLGVALNSRKFSYAGLRKNGFLNWDECEIQWRLPDPAWVPSGASGKVNVRVGLTNEYGEIVVVPHDTKLVIYKP